MEYALKEIQSIENQKLFQRTLEISHLGHYVIDFHGKTIEISPILEEILEWNDSRKVDFETFADFLLERCHPKDSVKCRDFLYKQIGEEKIAEVRLILPTTQNMLYLVFHSVPVYDERANLRARIGVVQDVTEQKLANLSLERYRAYLAVLAEIRRSFYDRTEEEIIHSFLDCTAKHFGFFKGWYGHLEGRQLFPRYFHGLAPKDREIFNREFHLDHPEIRVLLIEAIREKKPIMVKETPHLDNLPPLREMLIACGIQLCIAIPLEINGTIEGGYTFFSSDRKIEGNIIDYLKNAVNELGEIVDSKRRWSEQQETLKQAKEKAEVMTQAKSRFLANMSHEIRTPMTAILGYAEAITDRQISREQFDEATWVIRNNAEHLLNVLNDILDFSKIETDSLKISKRPINILLLVTEVASLFVVKVREKNLKLILCHEHDFPDTVVTDPFRLKQILMNLIGNAVKFTRKGEIRIVFSWLADDEQNGRLKIAVQDTGVGIPTEQIANIFEPFFQTDNSWTRQYGGTGLGLTISQRLAKLLDGEITILSAHGKGSTFSVILNQVLSDHFTWIKTMDIFPVMVNEMQDVEEDKSLSLSGARILLAEDGKDNQRLFALLLKKAGADVCVVDNGSDACREAMDTFRKGKPYDLILMDMQMPVMDGYTTTKMLRGKGYSLPIIALTAHAMSEEKQHCLDSGCDDYITKPILRDAFLAKIVDSLKGRKQSSSIR